MRIRLYFGGTGIVNIRESSKICGKKWGRKIRPPGAMNSPPCNGMTQIYVHDLPLRLLCFHNAEKWRNVLFPKMPEITEQCGIIGSHGETFGNNQGAIILENTWNSR
jgi:hypothetical protein